MENQEIITDIDDLILKAFGSEEVEKGMLKDMKPEKETADEAVKQAPKMQDDAARGAGRPNQISDVPEVDEDGKRAKEYDSAIAKQNMDGVNPEQKQIKLPQDMKKSITDAEYQEYQELKKAQAERDAQATKEAEKELIKSAVSEATKAQADEIAELKKSLLEQNDLMKSIANQPMPSKAVTDVNAVEKFAKSEAAAPTSYSKQEMLDFAEELHKSDPTALKLTDLIELDNTGYIYDANSRESLERFIKLKTKS